MTINCYTVSHPVTFLALWRKAAAVCLMATRISSSNDSSGARFLQNTAEQKCWNERWEPDSVTWEPDLCRYTTHTHTLHVVTLHAILDTQTSYSGCMAPPMQPGYQTATYLCHEYTNLWSTISRNCRERRGVDQSNAYIYSSLRSMEESLSKTFCTPTSNGTKSA